MAAERAPEAGWEDATGIVSPTASPRRVAPRPAVDVRVYSTLDALSERAAEFLSAASRQSFFFSKEWFRIILDTAGLPVERARIYVAETAACVAAILIVREREHAGPLKTHVVTSPSRGLDAYLHGPLLDAEHGEAGLDAIVGEMLRAAPPVHVFRFECLDPQSRECQTLLAALRRRHLLVRTFDDTFVLYSEDVGGLTFDEYLLRRTPEMRDFLARQVDAVMGTGRGRFAFVAGGAEFAAALVDYWLVDLKSWKSPEPYPDCGAKLIATALRAGSVRLGLLYVDGEAAAAQIWIVSAGRATLWRARFKSKFAMLSVGAVATFEMIRHIMATDRPRVLEFGPGNDPGRREWLARRHERIGCTVFNLRTAKGLAVFARHGGGLLAAGLRQRLRDPVRRLLARVRG